MSLSGESVRRWLLKFGHSYARRLKRFRPRPDDRWHLDEIFVTIRGKRMYLWRAVDAEGEGLDFLIQSKRDKPVALELIRKLLRKQGVSPTAVVIDKLPSYGAALRELGLSRRHERSWLEAVDEHWRRRAALPAFAALGGMVVPAAIYAGLNWDDPVAIRGWAIPTATDIVLALGVLSLAVFTRSHEPRSLPHGPCYLR